MAVAEHLGDGLSLLNVLVMLLIPPYKPQERYAELTTANSFFILPKSLLTLLQMTLMFLDIVSVFNR